MTESGTRGTRWREAKRLFEAAIAMEESQREAWLRDVCGSEAELHAEVQSLLDWHRDSTGFLETPAARVAELPIASTFDQPLVGQSIGAWRIVDVIGRGGMGVVYRAERADDAFQRQAAIKVVRFGRHSAHIVERFRRERETLAALDHPNIARLMDGGTTQDGQPYFVMELVDGIPVDQYCDEHKLTIEQRLDLFRAICAGVQYAHENLVVHRDIKPDNILVTRDGVPKLLDFGIATIVARDVDTGRPPNGGAAMPSAAVSQSSPASPSSSISPSSPFTPASIPAASWLMTPDYASPEQVAGRTVVTTPSDVYSLGVLLYVLLTGVRPYHLTGVTPADIQAQLGAATLVPPSERVRPVGDPEPSLIDGAARRATTPKALARRLAGDLDAIVLRALGREPASRYSSVERLAHDIECHHLSRPVSARGADAAYRARLFVRRHAVALGVAAVIALLAAGGIAGVLWQASVAAEARVRAERRFDDVRQLAHSFMFGVHDSIVNVPGTTEARALMVHTAVQYLEGIAREAAGDRVLQRELASAFVKVGDAQGHPTSANLGDTAGALVSYRRALSIAEVVLQAAPDDVEASRTLGMAHRRIADVLSWKGEMTAALEHCQRSGALFAVIAAHPQHTIEDRVQAGIASIKLGDLLGNPNFPNLGKAADAHAKYQVALGMFRRLDAVAPTNPRVRRYLGLTLERIGTLHELASRWPEATAAYQESFEIRKMLASTEASHNDIQRDYAVAYEKLGNIQRLTGNPAAAAVSYRDALGQFERLAKGDPSDAFAARSVAISREKLSGVEQSLGRMSEAVSLMRAALATHRGLADRDPENAQARCDSARVAESLGDLSRPPGEQQPGGATCAMWKDSLATRTALKEKGRPACTADADFARLAVKLRPC
jgi:serine/threonine protein kinase/tetratricopeptide (TPR) repeat protein